ncbi:MAG: NADH:flavin oxidoreductase [Planctomycetes bacterium SCN 63-9]|mgnify:CR=1 FL=1|nr:MAG: NADH:flavin oxidoreductase [Planctomycetes bacterium SCN 63-9]
MSFPRVASLKTADDFRKHLQSLGIALPFDATVEAGAGSPLARPFHGKSGTIGNRFCILPMEGWDGTPDGRPSELTRRRWRNFGLSGAKLIWGGEAVAVRHDGRANPHQLVIGENTLADLAGLRDLLVEAHRERFGQTDDLLIGLQLTHSGRFARPNGKQLEPRVLYRHPLLDDRFGVRDDSAVFSDDELARLVEDFVKGARLAQKAGYAFVDVKACHGYLGHEFLSAVDRPGRYGGSFENRTRFLREIVDGIRAEAPGLEIGVRLSIFDFLPFQPGPESVGIPAAWPGPYRHAFGGDGGGTGIDLAEPSAFLELLERLDIELFCSTAGSPYYNPHIQRPATFPPSDGYQPPEDPLVGVARQIEATARLKARHPKILVVGSGYSYLQEWLPNVGQAVVRENGADFVGLGRMVLSYPEMPADVLAGRALARKKICRTFSDCTTAPRNGIVSGCYPLDPFYKERPEREALAAAKEGLETRNNRNNPRPIS